MRVSRLIKSMAKIPSKQTQEILPTSRHCFYASCVICRLMLVIVSSSPLSRSSETQAHPLGVPLSQRFAAEARVRFGYPKRCDTALKGSWGPGLCKDVLSLLQLTIHIWVLLMIYWRTDAWTTSPLTTFCFFLKHSKRNIVHVAVDLSSNRWQKTSECCNIISNALSCASFATFLFSPHFDVSIWDPLLTRRMVSWNLLVK